MPAQSRPPLIAEIKLCPRCDMPFTLTLAPTCPRCGAPLDRLPVKRVRRRSGPCREN